MPLLLSLPFGETYKLREFNKEAHNKKTQKDEILMEERNCGLQNYNEDPICPGIVVRLLRINILYANSLAHTTVVCMDLKFFEQGIRLSVLGT